MKGLVLVPVVDGGGVSSAGGVAGMNEMESLEC